jgi:hypothetical protein
METPLFSAEQIKIPPELPEILKNYAKFVIKNHPENIYEASAEYPRLTRYFTKLATQSRQTVDAKLNVEQLTTFFKRFQASKPIVSHKDIEDACQWADVATSQIQDTFALGSWSGDQIPWISFWSFLLASVAGNLQDTLLLGVQIAAEQERIKLNIFKNLFEFLVSTDQQAPPHVVAAIKEFLSSSQGYF